MSAVLDYLKESGVFYLSTMDGNQPRVRPFGAVCEFEGKLYFITAKTKNVYKQLLENPRVEISAMKGQDSWIRLDGEVKMDGRREARAAMLEAVPVLKNMYNADDGVMTVFILITLKQRNIPLPANPKNWHNREFFRGGLFYRAVFF